MIQTQVMTASKITTVMPVLCDYILGMICLLNALPRPLVPLTLCQPSNLAGINFQPCKSLRSPLIPAQTSALALFPSLPLQQEALRAFSLCCPTSKGSLCTHIHGILPSKGDVWHREPGVTEIPGQQVKHLGWCTAKKAGLCLLRFTARDHQKTSLQRQHYCPLGKWGREWKRTHIVLFLGNSSTEAKSSPDPTKKQGREWSDKCSSDGKNHW